MENVKPLPEFLRGARSRRRVGAEPHEPRNAREQLSSRQDADNHPPDQTRGRACSICAGVLPSRAGTSLSLASSRSSLIASPSTAARSSGLSGTSSRSRVRDDCAASAAPFADDFGRLKSQPTQAILWGQVVQNGFVQYESPRS